MTFLPGHFAQSDVQQRAAARYSGDTVATASPAKLVVLLYDRLLLDLTRAQQAQELGDRHLANAQLSHAQDIVAELLSSLDTTKWDGAAGLSSIYTFLLAELTRANVSGDPRRTAGCITVIRPLADAWTQAAAQLAAGTAGSAVPAMGLTG
ncbi:flagellar export chaperone FliS [Angustibacter aerolatus]